MTNLTTTAPPYPVAHALGPVANDWEAAEVWLRAIAQRARKGSPETVATYRQHLAKLRWYCENVAGSTPSRWSVQDVEAFFTFLAKPPESALCARPLGRRGFARPGESGYTPFRCAPSAGSQADIRRCVHALLRAWRETGYIQINPMGLHGAGTVRKINARRAVGSDLYEMVLETMEAAPRETFEKRQRYLRDRFILITLRDLGLRASELVKASMGAFYRLSDPKDGRTYWVLHVTEETAKGRRSRKVPVTRRAMESLGAYRLAFGMPTEVLAEESTALLLSPRTDRSTVTSGGSPIADVQSRRYFGAWRPVTTRQGLYVIVKDRFAEAALFLEGVGDIDRARLLREASPHWLRHSFAKGALLAGQDMRSVAAALGHSDMSTTMIYTEQEALDLIRATELAAPGVLAVEERVN